LEESVNNIFDNEGKRINNEELYHKNKSSKNCKYCEFKKTKYCDA
jgi:CRISPR/Cas system-associated exonuclease Cas4 (RecB family)